MGVVPGVGAQVRLSGLRDMSGQSVPQAELTHLFFQGPILAAGRGDNQFLVIVVDGDDGPMDCLSQFRGIAQHHLQNFIDPLALTDGGQDFANRDGNGVGVHLPV